MESDQPSRHGLFGDLATTTDKAIWVYNGYQVTGVGVQTV